MDYNEDRQILDYKHIIGDWSKQKSLGPSVVKLDESQQAFIYLDTIGMCFGT